MRVFCLCVCVCENSLWTALVLCVYVGCFIKGVCLLCFKMELAWPPPHDRALLKYLPSAKNCHFARRPPISHLARVTLDYFHPLPPCQAYMIRPWWLLLSFSLCNVVFHAFLPDLLDQQYSLCPSAPPPSSPCPFPPSIGLTYTAESREPAFHQGGFSGSLDRDALIDFLSPPIFGSLFLSNGE